MSHLLGLLSVRLSHGQVRRQVACRFVTQQCDMKSMLVDPTAKSERFVILSVLGTRAGSSQCFLWHMATCGHMPMDKAMIVELLGSLHFLASSLPFPWTTMHGDESKKASCIILDESWKGLDIKSCDLLPLMFATYTT